MTSPQLELMGMPSFYNDQLLNHIVDYIATVKPQTLYAEYPLSPVSYEAGFRKITYVTFANAINRIAWWLHDNLGPGENFDALAYIGPNNLTYPSLILGAVKAGYKILLLSPRNSVSAQLHLLRTTDCKVLITPIQRPTAVTAILSAQNNGLRVLEIPPVDELLNTHSLPFHYGRSFDQARQHPLTVMHTSGSTGFPKPITWTHDFVAAYARQLQLDPPQGFESNDKLYEGNRVFMMFPPFHAAYIAHVLVNAITNQTAMIFPLEASIPSAKSLSDALKSTKVDAAFVVPSIIEEISQSPDLLDHISANLDTLVYSGGDLPQGCGDVVTSKIPIINFYGTTETASVAIIRPERKVVREDWKYLYIHPSAGVELRRYAADMYELYIIRHPLLEDHQQVFKIFPDLQEYRTRDLFVRHPLQSKRSLWSHCGRADDIVVFSTGEKFNPVLLEQYIFSSHSEISGVLVAGSQRFQAALLIELRSMEEVTSIHRAEFTEKIWPTVQRANKNSPAHAQIARSHILFTHSQLPMVRTSKGTIQRLATLAQYTKELDALYLNADKGPGSWVRASVDLQDTNTVLSYLKDTVSSITAKVSANEDNFFTQGMDSLQALLLTRKLKHALAMPHLALSIVYANPSIPSLATALQQISGKMQLSKSPQKQTLAHTTDTTLLEYQTLVDRISIPVQDNTPKKGPGVIVLSGSTGALGSYLLQILLSTTTNHIICLNRSRESASLQQYRSQTRGLSAEFPTTRVTFLTAEFSRPHLGLESHIYSDLLQRVTGIIHNAWPVNFNFPLSSFRPQLTGVANLIEFATSAAHSPLLLYVSSISSVSGYRASTIPEEVIHDAMAPGLMGYAESKYISERMLCYATQRLPLRTRIARVGQIAGPIQGSGCWNRSEWLPSLVISSLHVGALPESLGVNLDRIDWVPIDLLAKALVELLDCLDAGTDPETLQSSESLSGHSSVFNVLNPRPVQWRALLPTITRVLSSVSLRNGGKPVETVSLATWIEKVRDRTEARSGDDRSEHEEFERLLQVNPAIKLLEFYEEACTTDKRLWDTRKAERVSAALRILEGIKEEWMEKWMKDWLT
ncbi:hypothetical protein MMC30_006712 [Trapelia coarctata]|nr:hypothetical protein [Trapelia coarctata]